MSRYHFHRVFKTATGSHAAGVRLGPSCKTSARGAARRCHGDGSNLRSRLRLRWPLLRGLRRRCSECRRVSYRRGGRAETIRFALGECSLGSILVAATAKGVCAILLGDDPEPLVRDLEDRFANARLVGGDEAFEGLVARAIALTESPARGHDLPLDVRGTAVPAAGLAGAARYSGRLDRELRGGRRPHRCTRCGAGGRPGLRGKPGGGGDPVPPGRAPRRRALRLPLGRGSARRPCSNARRKPDRFRPRWPVPLSAFSGVAFPQRYVDEILRATGGSNANPESSEPSSHRS